MRLTRWKKKRSNERKRFKTKQLNWSLVSKMWWTQPFLCVSVLSWTECSPGWYQKISDVNIIRYLGRLCQYSYFICGSTKTVVCFLNICCISEFTTWWKPSVKASPLASMAGAKEQTTVNNSQNVINIFSSYSMRAIDFFYADTFLFLARTMRV